MCTQARLAVLMASLRPCMLTMQMTASAEQMQDMEHYIQKTYCKTASLMANSARSIAVLGGQSPQVGFLACVQHTFML